MFAYIDQSKRRNLDPKAKRYTLVGYSITGKGYRLFHQQTGKVDESRDVRFNESSLGHSTGQKQPSVFEWEHDSVDLDYEQAPAHAPVAPAAPAPAPVVQQPVADQPQEQERVRSVELINPMVRRESFLGV